MPTSTFAVRAPVLRTALSLVQTLDRAPAGHPADAPLVPLPVGRVSTPQLPPPAPVACWQSRWSDGRVQFTAAAKALGWTEATELTIHRHGGALVIAAAEQSDGFPVRLTVSAEGASRQYRLRVPPGHRRFAGSALEGRGFSVLVALFEVERVVRVFDPRQLIALHLLSQAGAA